jgi:hypothetical protein
MKYLFQISIVLNKEVYANGNRNTSRSPQKQNDDLRFRLLMMITSDGRS